MAGNINVINGVAHAIGKQVLVKNMHFGDQVTNSGIIISSDNGKTRGIYPRWAQVHSKGPKNTDPYATGNWILIEHGRWTRSILVNEGAGDLELRMVDVSSVLAWSETKPSVVQLGAEYADGAGVDIRPEDFIN